MKTEVTITEMIELLNEAHRLDPGAINRLFAHREPCNPDLAEHPTVQILQETPLASPAPGTYRIGPLGLLNGLFGIDEDGMGPICMLVADDGVTIIRFEEVPLSPTPHTHPTAAPTPKTGHPPRRKRTLDGVDITSTEDGPG